MKNAREEGLERMHKNDVHPQGAHDGEGNKLAVLGCHCRYCVQEEIDRSGLGFARDRISKL